jgi:hypothetical protein
LQRKFAFQAGLFIPRYYNQQLGGNSMANKEIGKLTFHIEPGALREIIGSGRLTEFANKAAAHAAYQVNAQVVDLVSQAAIEKGSIENGISVSFSTIFEDGDFGSTGPRKPGGPRPRVGIAFGGSALSQVVNLTAEGLAE